MAFAGVVYPIASHWTWAKNGWLKVSPYQDYAGGGVVHMTGGVIALVGAWLMGPRIGRYVEKVCQRKKTVVEAFWTHCFIHITKFTKATFLASTQRRVNPTISVATQFLLRLWEVSFSCSDSWPLQQDFRAIFRSRETVLLSLELLSTLCLVSKSTFITTLQMPCVWYKTKP